jgi:hypothetical protein
MARHVDLQETRSAEVPKIQLNMEESVSIARDRGQAQEREIGKNHPGRMRAGDPGQALDA